MKTNVGMIKEIIENQLFTNVFQPIYHLSSQKIVGYESLLRCEFVKSPDMLFNCANSIGCLYHLDIASITNSIKDFAMHSQAINSRNLFLSLNVYPSTIAAPTFPKILEQLVQSASLVNQQVILEINESERIKNLDEMLQNVHLLKQKGFMIAVDDLGKGEYSLQALIEIDPQVIKLDRYFAKDLSKSKKKQRALLSTIRFFNENTRVILEGIETKEDLWCAKSLGILYAQGYFLAKPEPLHEALNVKFRG
ncbi:EAL domain-containing protein [Anoxybacteroides tepidamans]|uniref:EAL domain-containing protein n=1 Tax=Anoxybacteroides tepidamans TaxID=265948 RepID=UPI0004856B9E|nr:EAL domain-containing protein [Anoxybacillus tepidamans]